MKRRALLSMLASVPAAAAVLVTGGAVVAMGAATAPRKGRRISTQPNDPGYRTDAVGGPYEVFCNGVRLRYCVMADEGLGQAKCVAHDANGRFLADPSRQDVFYHWHYGHVEIREKDPRNKALARRHA